jgi:hypothetical protein
MASTKSARVPTGQVGHVTRCIHLHIGPRKSGTTFLQQALISNAQALRAEGLLYPMPGRSLRQRVLGAPQWLNHEEELLASCTAEASSTTEWLAHALAATSGDIILSGEAVAACSPAELDHLIANVGARGAQVSVVTVPAGSAPAETLWQRFLGALGLSNAAIAAFTIPKMQPLHVGLTAPEALTLREIVWQLECGGMDRPERRQWARRLVDDVFRGRPTRGPALHLTGTDLHRARQWAADDSAQLAILVENGQIALYGDLADLTPSEIVVEIDQAQLSREITNLGGRCIAYLEGARS